MKNIIIIFVFFFYTTNLFSQAPQSMNYQAIARDVIGEALPNISVNVEFIIHDGSQSGNIVFDETQTLVTNQFGLFTASIGTGNLVSGNFSTVAWGGASKYLEVKVNNNSLGTSQLLSVPYALNAASGGTIYTPGTGINIVGATISNTITAIDNLSDVNTVGVVNGQVLKYNGTNWIPGTDNTSSGGLSVSPRISGDGTIALPLDIAPQGAANGQVLKFNGSQWSPGADNSNVGTVTSITAGIGLSGGTITSIGTISMPNVGTPATYGSINQIPVITTDAQGRVSNVTLAPLSNSGWGLYGNAGTIASNFIGTSDNRSFRIKTNNNLNAIFDSLGNVGIGTANPAPAYKLDVSGKGRFTQGVIGNSVSPYGAAVYGNSSAADHDFGVYGASNTSTGVAVYGYAPSGSAGYFSGKVEVYNGNFCVTGGKVGIGTTTPKYPLDIRSTGIQDTFSLGHAYTVVNYNGTNSTSSTSLTINSISLYASNDILSGGSFYALSDSRIKKDFNLSDCDKDISILSQLKVTNYRYKDELEHGRDYKKGFIAQDVKQVFPEAVSTHTDFITDIFSKPEKAVIKNNKLILTMKIIHGLCDGDEVRLYTSSGKKDVKVLVNDDYSFSISDWNENDTDIFVYGKKTADFLAVDYDRIYTLNVSATQDLIRRVSDLEKENADQKQMNEQLMFSINQLKAEVELIKNSTIVHAQK